MKLVVLTVVGLAMLVTGIVTIIWSGLILKNIVVNMIGCIVALSGLLMLTKEVRQS